MVLMSHWSPSGPFKGRGLTACWLGCQRTHQLRRFTRFLGLQSVPELREVKGQSVDAASPWAGVGSRITCGKSVPLSTGQR